jgi:hypothetical protein
MKQLNFSDAEKNQLLRVVAAILQLGNIVFGPNRDGSGSVVTNQDGNAHPPFIVGLCCVLLVKLTLALRSA